MLTVSIAHHDGTEKFSTLPPGSLFLRGNGVFIVMHAPSTEEYNAVELASGRAVWVPDDARVRPAKGNLRVEIQQPGST